MYIIKRAIYLAWYSYKKSKLGGFNTYLKKENLRIIEKINPVDFSDSMRIVAIGLNHFIDYLLGYTTL